MSAVPWVLLRGLTRDARHWGGFAARFAAATAPAATLALDLPGNGSERHRRSPATVEAMAAFARAALRERGVAPPYRVLAMSLGAMVASAWAAAHPDEIDALVLINASMRPTSPFHHRLRPRHYLPLLGLLAGRADALSWERTILRITSRGAHDADALVRAWAAFRREQPVAALDALRQLVAAARFRAPPHLARVLLLASAGDALVDPRCSSALAQRWGCALRLHPWAGHDLPLDDPAWVIDEVLRWVDQVGFAPFVCRAPACFGA